MKKILLVTLTTLLSIVAVNAQDEGDIELGANIGINFPTAVSNQITANSATRFNFAALGEYYFSDTWGLKAKLIYDQKGWADGFIQTPTGTRVTSFKLNYVTIPVMANWHFGSTRKWFLNFGLYAAFLLDAQAAEVDLTDSFQGSDFGLAFGIGYKFPIDDTTKLFVELDGQSGFGGIFKQGETVRNSRSALNLGVLFDL